MKKRDFGFLLFGVFLIAMSLLVFRLGHHADKSQKDIATTHQGAPVTTGQAYVISALTFLAGCSCMVVAMRRSESNQV